MNYQDKLLNALSESYDAHRVKETVMALIIHSLGTKSMTDNKFIETIDRTLYKQFSEVLRTRKFSFNLQEVALISSLREMDQIGL